MTERAALANVEATHDVQPFRERVLAWLNAPLDASALAVYRVAIGLLVSFSAVRFLAYGWIDEFFVRPRFFFKYWGFSWVFVPSATALYALFIGLAVLGLSVAVGLFYRVAIVALALGFTYVQLLDATNYLNHYYLVSLLLGLMALMPLGHAYGLDAWRKPLRRVVELPAWMTYLLRFQVGCVYFYAGKAKLGVDWLLSAQPLHIWLSSRQQTPLLGALFGIDGVPHLFAWAGFLFDTSIVAFLLWRRTRIYAYVVVIAFHVMTKALFPIGMFPFIMVTSALIFFSPDWPRRWWPRFVRPVAARDTALRGRLSPILLVPLAVFCLFQAMWPLRHHVYGGNVLWHEQGMRFSWKVMVREKNASVTYHVEDKKTGRTWYLSPRAYLDARQEREFSGQPDFILQLGHAIASDYRARGVDVRVRAEVWVSLNGRPPALLIDPNVDLANIPDGLAPARWILSPPEVPAPRLRPVG